MKKRNLSIAVVAALVAVAIGAFGLFAFNFQKIKSKQQKTIKEIALKIGDKEVEIPYAKLGISMISGESKPDDGLGMASVLSAGLGYYICRHKTCGARRNYGISVFKPA
ncbi:hypothetical protein HZA42_05330 [Candidatus Peregrinibacteria bacterium]|nr:hypothetical protein [Candidatus Peregrinibacteria bacterium]